MLLRFVAGRAGSGKSTWVYDVVKRHMEAGPKPVYVVVPEQYTLQTEKELLAALGKKGFLQARVTSPTRLAEEVFAQVEQSRRTAVGESGLAMALRAAASRVAGELDAFRPVLAFQGFSQGMVRLIAELKRYDVAPDELLTASQAAKGALRAKTKDIATIYREYSSVLEARSFIDSADRFNGFIDAIARAEFLRGCAFYFDGFDTLSPQHCRMIGELLALAESVTVTLDYDGFESADTGLFRAAQWNISRLSAIAEGLGADIKWTHLRAGERQRAMPPDVAHLERALFAWPTDPKRAEGGVTLCQSSSPEEEVEAAGVWIVEHVRREGLRWREVAVQCGDLNAYGPIVSRAFARNGIPVFIDSRKAIIGHPAVRFLLSLIRVIERDYRTDDVLRLVKTGFAGVGAEVADRLEVWLTAFAPRGARMWARDWEKGQDTFDLVELNKSRKAIYELAQALVKRAGGKKAPGSSWAKALYGLLADHKLDERLDAQAASLKREGLLEEAAVTERVWNAVIDLIDQMDEIIGDEELDAAGFRAILQSGLEAVEEGILPTGVDQVQVGSIGRAKYSGLKYMLILGASDGSLSAVAPESGGILTGRDIDALAALGVEVGRGSALKESQQRFALYQAIAKGASGLYVSWPEQGDVKPDRIVERIRELLSLDPGDVLDASDLAARPSTAAAGFARLPLRLRLAAEGAEPGGDLLPAMHWYLSEPDYRSRLMGLMQGVAGEPLREYLPAAGLALGNATAMSASQLEAYWNCPFRHFVDYVLVPQPWRQHGVESADAGLFMHAAMERFSQRLQAIRFDLGNLDEGQVATMMMGETARLADEFQYGLLKGSARLSWTGGNLQRTCTVAAATFARQLLSGDFVPYGQEVRFGKGSFPPAAIQMPDGSHCYLQGRIDRMDVWRAGETDFLRVIDYKSGRATIDVHDAVNGLDMQTWLYLYALRQLWARVGGRPAVAAGAFIFPLIDPWVEEGDEEEQERRKALRMRGWCLNDTAVIAAMDRNAAGGKSELYGFNASRKSGVHDNKTVDKALELIAGNARESIASIRKGHVGTKPWRSGKETACGSCPYGALCRFDVCDPKRYRALLDNETIDQMLAEKGESGDEMDR